MQTKEILLKLRIQNGWSQEDLAERVYVTRQAVSRWENGETVPNTETLKLLSKLFDVSINTPGLTAQPGLPVLRDALGGSGHEQGSGRFPQ